MLKKGDSVLVWLFDKAARLLVGAPSSKEESRWVAIGTVLDVDGQDIWLDSGRIEEWKPDGKTRVAWKFTPKTFLIQRQFIITVQVAKSDDREIGFKAEKLAK